VEVAESAVIPRLRRIAPAVFRDDRGEFLETWNAEAYAFAREDGTPIAFVEDDLSQSRAGVLRGLHGDDRTWKLIQCVQGSLHVVVADLRAGSPGYRRWEAFGLSATNRVQLLVPAGCATGLLALEDPSTLAYKQSERYQGATGQFTVRWDDPALAIEWPADDPILSARDAGVPDLDA